MAPQISIMLVPPTDEAGIERLRNRHDQTQFATLATVMGTVSGIAIFRSIGGKQDFAIQSVEFGETPNLQLARTFIDMQSCLDIKNRHLLRGEEREIVRAAILFLSEIVDIASESILNCSADIEKSFELDIALRQSITAVLNGIPPSVEIEVVGGILKELPCYAETIAA